MIDYNDIEKAIRPNTKAVVCTHGSNLTGNLVDIERIGKITRKNGLLLVVDASQTAGVFPIDVEKCRLMFFVLLDIRGFLVPRVQEECM